MAIRTRSLLMTLVAVPILLPGCSTLPDDSARRRHGPVTVTVAKPPASPTVATTDSDPQAGSASASASASESQSRAASSDVRTASHSVDAPNQRDSERPEVLLPPAEPQHPANSDRAAGHSPNIDRRVPGRTAIALKSADAGAVTDIPERSSENGLTLDAIEDIAMANNPAIQQAAAASARAGGIRMQVGLKPNPLIGYFGEEIGDEGTAGLQGAFVSQTFVRGDKLAWNQTVINYDVQAMNWQLATTRQRVRTDIRVAFYAALTAQKRLQLAEDFRPIAEEGVRISIQRLEDAKVGTRPDVLQSQIQLNEVDLTIQHAEIERNAALSELAAIAGVSDLGTSTLIGSLPTELSGRNADDEYNRIVGSSPLLAAARARVGRARADLRRQEVQPIPNLQTQLGVGGNDSSGDTFANVQLSLPVPIHNRNQGNVRAAWAEYCAATRNVERLQQSLRRDLARAMRDYNMAAATVRQFEEAVIPKAEETLSLIKQAQDAGEFDFLRVLTARRSLLDARLRYVAALGQLARADAQIDGLLLTDGLSNSVNYDVGDDLRGQTLTNQ